MKRPKNWQKQKSLQFLENEYKELESLHSTVEEKVGFSITRKSLVLKLIRKAQATINGGNEIRTPDYLSNYIVPMVVA